MHQAAELTSLCRFIADQVIGLLQSLASEVLLRHKHHHSQLPDQEPLPPPMFPGNWANATEICIRDADMHALLDSTEVCLLLLPCAAVPAKHPAEGWQHI